MKWKQLVIVVILWYGICMQCWRCQEAITNWSKGHVTHYGTVSNSAVVPQLSCGFFEGQPNMDDYPYGYFGSLSTFSNISQFDNQQGCGTCLEIKCGEDSVASGTCLLTEHESIVITVFDLCAPDNQRNECSEDGIMLPAYVFQELAPFQVGQLDVESRQISCEPNVNMTLIIDEYLRGSANYIALKFKNVAGQGSIQQVYLRQTTKINNNSTENLTKWLEMNRRGQAGFDFNGAPDPPLDLQLISKDGEIIVLRGIVQEQTKVGEYSTRTQFSGQGVQSEIPQIVDFFSEEISLSTECSCFDKRPQIPGFSCDYQKQFSRCDLDFMIQQDYCAKTCGRCTCYDPPATNASIPSLTPTPNSTPNFAPTSSPIPTPTPFSTATPTPPTTEKISFDALSQLQNSFTVQLQQQQNQQQQQQYAQQEFYQQQKIQQYEVQQQNLQQEIQNQDKQLQVIDPPLLAMELPKVNSQQNQSCMLSLAGLLESSVDLQMFYEALSASRIQELLQDTQLALTVLAPNNFAFNKFIQKTGISWENFKLNFPGLLQRIVLYLIVPGVWDTDQLWLRNHDQKNPLEIVTLLPNSAINITILNDNSIEIFGPINSGRSKWVDLSICNSVVHDLNDVIIPFTDYDFTSLAEFQQITELPINLNSEIRNDNNNLNSNLGNEQQILQLLQTKQQYYFPQTELSEFDDNISTSNQNFTQEKTLQQQQQQYQLPESEQKAQKVIRNSTVVLQSNQIDSREEMEQTGTVFDDVAKQISDLVSDSLQESNVQTAPDIQYVQNSQNGIYQTTTQNAQFTPNDATIVISPPTDSIYPFSTPINSYGMNILYENQYSNYQYQNLDFSDLTQMCPSVFQIIQRNQNLGVFEQLLVSAGYDKTLSQISRQFTIFAPTDNAFLELLKEQNINLQELTGQVQELQKLIGYHIVDGLYNMDELRILAVSPVASNKLTTYLYDNGQQTLQLEVMQDLEGSTYIKGVGSNGTLEREIRSCESVVHIVDSVLLPFQLSRSPPSPTVVSFGAQSSREFNLAQTSPSTITLSQYQYDGTALEDEQGVVKEGNIVLVPTPTIALQECRQMSSFFGARGASWADLRYFKILMDVTYLANTLYNTRTKVNLFVPTNDGFDSGLQVINATFNELLMDIQAADKIVKYHVTNGEQRIENFVQYSQSQRVDIPTALDGQNIQFQSEDFLQNGQLAGVTSYATRAKITEKIETCQGMIYVLDKLLLPQGFRINGK